MKRALCCLFVSSLFLLINLLIPAASAQNDCTTEEETVSIGTCVIPSSFSQTALSDMVGQFYLTNYPGGLYGSTYGNQDPTQHINDGVAAANNIHPRLTSGAVDNTNGWIIFLSIGMSNCTIDFCGGSSFLYGDLNQPQATCCPNPTSAGYVGSYNQSDSFMGQGYGAAINPRVALFDGAKGQQTFDKWDPAGYYGQPGVTCPFTDPPDQVDPYCNLDRVKGLLGTNGFSENQVQAVWIDDANASPACSLGPTNGASQFCPDNNNRNPDTWDAFVAERYLGNIVRALYLRYPYLQQIFISSRNYGGYANTIAACLSPEPFAFEYGISVQRLVLAQIYQAANNGASNGDPYAGNLYYVRNGHLKLGQPVPAATWIDWGPYTWANGDNPRSDNQLVWCNDPGGAVQNLCQFKEDFRNGNQQTQGDLTHPSTQGEHKTGNLLLTFMQNNQATFTRWFWP